MGHPAGQHPDGRKIPTLADLSRQPALLRHIGKGCQTPQEETLSVKNGIETRLENSCLPVFGRRGGKLEGQFKIVMPLLFLISKIELFADIAEGNGPLPFPSKDLLSAHLKVLLCDSVKDTDPALIIGKDDRLLQVSEEDLVEVLFDRCILTLRFFQEVSPYPLAARCWNSSLLHAVKAAPLQGMMENGL